MPSSSDQPANESESSQPEFANRAERRAHGKKKPAQHSQDPQEQRFHGRVAGQSRRQYGNRRTG